MCKLGRGLGLGWGELVTVNLRGIFSALFFESKGSSKISDCLRLQPVKYIWGLRGEDCV